MSKCVYIYSIVYIISINTILCQLFFARFCENDVLVVLMCLHSKNMHRVDTESTEGANKVQCLLCEDLK